MTRDDTNGMERHDPFARSDVDGLASQVISVLRDRQGPGTTGTRQFILDYLVRVIIDPRQFDAMLVLDQLRGYRLTTDAIIDLYVPEAAQRLGEDWMRSDIDFATVTIGALRLQNLLSEAAAEIPHLPIYDATRLSALIIVPDGEQHFLGASVAGAQLRRLGCDVKISFCETQDMLQDRLSYDAPDMVLFSCARLAALETITKTVKSLRSSVEPVPVLALGGPLSGKADGIREKTGVDLVTNTVKEVVAVCTKRCKALDGS
ncbi:MAG: hypothetical protein AAF729_04875 [Pseudomonadota bacterium]